MRLELGDLIWGLGSGIWGQGTENLFGVTWSLSWGMAPGVQDCARGKGRVPGRGSQMDSGGRWAGGFVSGTLPRRVPGASSRRRLRPATLFVFLGI